MAATDFLRKGLAALLLLACAPLAAYAPGPVDIPTKAVVNPSTLTGLWFDPAQGGQGFSFTFAQDGRVAATWYVYNGGRQIWLIGTGNLVGNTAVLSTVITSGAMFPPAFQTSQVQLTTWGTLTLTVQDCDRIGVAWAPTLAGFPSGSMTVRPLISSGGLACQVTNNDDHGGICAEATSAPLNGSVSGRIEPGDDVDFFRVVLTQPGNFIATSRAGAGLDPLGKLHDADCNELIESDDVVASDFRLSRVLQPGTYYVSVRSFNAESVGDYAVDLSFAVVTPGADDHRDDCDTTSIAPLNGQVSGRIEPSNDFDFFRIVVTQTGGLVATSSNIDTLDPAGRIFDSRCEQVADNDDSSDTNRNFAVSALLQPGTYFLAVRSFNEESEGNYTVAFAFTTTAPDDHGNDCDNATAAGVGGQFTGNIDPQFDQDFFRLVLPNNSMLIASTDISAGSLDSQIDLLDRNCVMQASDDDGGPGRASIFAFALDADTYYVRVRSYSAESSGPYTLTLRYIPQVPGPDEHGDSCPTATQLGAFGSARGRIDPANDVDYFRVDNEFANLTFVAQSYNSTFDPFGEILGPDCQPLAQNDDSSGLEFTVSTPAAQDTTYYIRVSSAGGNSSGDYSLDYYFIAVARAAAAAKRAGAGPVPAKAVIHPGSLSGLWYDAQRSGQGFAIDFDEANRVAVTWYVYNAGQQIWLVGSGALNGNRATVPAFIASGGQFPPGFDPGAVTLTPWGTLTLDVRSCQRITASWNSTIAGYGIGSLELEPLLLAGGLVCEVTAEADDHGDACAAASALNPNGSVSGRIDPATDSDFFRIAVAANGTLAVQSAAVSSLNPQGTLYDSACQPLADSDDAAGSEFAISRAVTAGTYYVRVRSSGAATVGGYSLTSAFAAQGQSAGVTLSLRNDLVYDVDFRANNGAPIRVAAGATLSRDVSVNGPLSVTFALVGATALNGAPIGDLQGGAFDPVASPSGTVQFRLDNVIGNQTYFAPVITNNSGNGLLIGVNMGLPAENRCNCTVANLEKDVRVGYYRLDSTSNVRGYAVGSNYTGTFTAFPTTGFGVPLSTFVEPGTGRVGVNFKRPINP